MATDTHVVDPKWLMCMAEAGYPKDRTWRTSRGYLCCNPRAYSVEELLTMHRAGILSGALTNESLRDPLEWLRSFVELNPIDPLTPEINSYLESH